MKTSFQISKYLPQEQPGRHSLPQASLPVSTNISVSGPHGPVFPAGPHQLSSMGRAKIRSRGMPSFCQIATESSSIGTFSLPSKTVTYSASGLNPRNEDDVRNS